MPRTSSTRRFSLRFHGVRGSHCVCGPQFLQFGGHTSCVSVEAGDWLVLLDLGTGVIDLGLELVNGAGGPRPLLALISHPHRDHLAGFPFLKPVYRPDWKIDVLGPALRGRGFDKLLAQSMEPPFFPVAMEELQAKITAGSFDPARALWLLPGGKRQWRARKAAAPANVLKITALHNSAHPKDGVFNYRLEFGGKSLVYATDTEAVVVDGGPFQAFARGADLLIHDAQYTPAQYDDPGPDGTRGFGHSTWPMACAAAKTAAVKSLVLFHHDPGHSDADLKAIERQAVKLFPGCKLAREGMEIEL